MKRVLILLVVAFTVSSVNATIINVPSDQPNIQAGVDAAAVGDTVLLAVGIYTGNGNRDVEFRGKNVVVRSVAGPSWTTIDCRATPGESHSAFWLHEAEDTSSVIDGFTITGAYAKGAIMCSTSVATIKNCVIQVNHGNGIYCYQPYGTIVGVAPLQVTGCEISKNVGNGIWTLNRSVNIDKCEVFANDSSGIYYYATWRYSTFTRLLIRDNGQFGLFMGVNLAGGAKVENATIIRNDRGLYFFSDFPKSSELAEKPTADSTVIRSCIVAFNTQQGIWTSFQPPWTFGFCNDAFGNASGDYAGPISFHAGDTLGNISIDPLFCDRTAGDFRLSSQSPCAPANNSCHTLMGVYDVACTCCIGMVGNVDGDPADLVDIGDLSAMVDHLFFGYPVTPCFDEVDMDRSGSIDISDLQALIDFIFKGVPLPSCP